MRTIRGAVRATLVLVLAAVLVGANPAPAAAEPVGRPSESTTPVPSSAGWLWPLAGFRIVQPYRAPAHAYGPGHRGIDLEPRGQHGVRAPAGGVVAFAGRVAGRGILTIDHGDGLVTTLEPITSALVAGDRVLRGQTVGALSTGGHTAPGALHFGVRRDGVYINPWVLLGAVPRAVLLPCCS
jgi:murein DD-endopeptidase MepM/ murein hydrolase activator NlpD